jgi:hypothetical protein
MRRFHRPRRVMKSQHQKRLIGLHRQSINIRRRSRISENNSYQPLHQQSRRKGSRKQQCKLQEIEQQVSTTTDLFDKATQLWTKLEEDQQVQKWDKEEERINAVIQELK